MALEIGSGAVELVVDVVSGGYLRVVVGAIALVESVADGADLIALGAA